MKKKLRTYIDTARHHCLRATPASVFIDGVALLMTTLFYWIYFQIFLFVHDLFPEPELPRLASLTDEWGDQWTITARLAFELVALGVLWRYLTPKRVYRYWLVPIKEVASPFVQSWKGVAKTLVTIVCFFCLSVGAPIALIRLYDYYRPRTPHSSHLNDDELLREAIRQGPVLSSSATPCYSTDQEVTSKPED
jgi:hypothetical protein